MILKRTEVWRDVPGYEGRYQVSNRGRVLSYPTSRRTWAKFLSPKISNRGTGYRQVSLCHNGVDGRKIRYWPVPHLVLLAFKGPCPEGMEACHRDGNSQNDWAYNLRWGTHRSNIEDKRAHGTLVQGESQWLAKVTPEIVADIRNRRALGESGLALAAEYEIDPSTVSDIYRRKSWKHL